MRSDFFRCLKCFGTNVNSSSLTWSCRQCGAQYAVEEGIPILVHDWSRHAEELEQARTVNPSWYIEEQPPEQSSPWRHHLRKRREYVEKSIREYLRDKGRLQAETLLDLGCGDGNHLEYLQKYTDALFGSDYNLVRLVRSRLRQIPATLFLADILEYPARDEFFEIVFFNHVIEHIRDDGAALAAVYRLLKPGGLLILGTPNEGAWWWQLAYRVQPETLQKTDHVHFYTAGVLVARLEARGFVIGEVKYLGWGPPHWGWDGRIRRYKWVDDWLEWIGRIIIPQQASSLYVVASKPVDGK